MLCRRKDVVSLYERQIRIFDNPKFAEPFRNRIRENAAKMAAEAAMEPCSTCKPWHNKQTGKTYLVPDDRKCLHYYFYFVDEELGPCHVRVPTWLPCRMQIC